MQEEKTRLGISGESSAKYFLKLVKKASGVGVIACDEKGEPVSRGNLLFFKDTGDIILSDNINPDLGFSLNKEGELAVRSSQKCDCFICFSMGREAEKSEPTEAEQTGESENPEAAQPDREAILRQLVEYLAEINSLMPGSVNERAQAIRSGLLRQIRAQFKKS